MSDDINRLAAENQRLKSALKELAVLNDISSAINSTMTPQEISRRIMKKVVTVLDAAEAAVHTFSLDDKNIKATTFVRGKIDSSSQEKARLNHTIIGWIAKNKKPLIINDARKDYRFRNSNVGDVSVKSLLAVPLSVKGRLIGSLTVFNSSREKGFIPDDIRLLAIIGSQAAQILENARLYQKELELHQIEGELDAARKTQESFLPSKIPTVEGFEIFGSSVAARHVGGDYYDFIPAVEGSLFFTLGDVSGKGMPAALLMSTLQGYARMMLNRKTILGVGQLLTELNQVACQMSMPTQFATMLAGKLTPGQNEIMIANGGHNFPIIVRANGAVEEVEFSSLLIGMFENTEYESSSVLINPGDLFVVASDGIEEAMDSKMNEFGLERFKELLHTSHKLSAIDIYKTIVDAVAIHRGDAEQSDDITLVVIKRL